MVFQQVARQSWDIWRIPGRGSNRDRVPERLIASSASDLNMTYSSDGRRIVFSSSRSGGVANVWICDNDGTNPVQLTRFERDAGTARWSPDGRRVLFDSDQAGDYNLYVIDSDGGVPRRLTPQASSDVMGTWSRDGRWVYFRSDRGGSHQLWKIPAEGGEAVQVTRGGGSYAEESWDGRELYYRTSGSIWRVPVGGGDKQEVLRVPGMLGRSPFVSRTGLYYLRQLGKSRSFSGPQGRRPGLAIDYLDFESGRVTTVFEDEGFIPHHDLTVSPDEGWILVPMMPRPVSELMLMENFR